LFKSTKHHICRIRTRAKNQDTHPNPHQSEKSDPDLHVHQSEKSDLDLQQLKLMIHIRTRVK
jgi:hypothetical protein